MKRLNDIFRKILKVEMNDYQQLTRENCSKWDSLNHMNLVFALEDEFDIQITQFEIPELKSFNDFIAILNKYGVMA
jgi:acyl carrier protein